MQKIVLISCASKKLDVRAPAREMYVSALFEKNLVFAEAMQPDHIFILSAKYGLLKLDQEIDPYDVTLNNMTATQVKAWANGVLAKLARHANLEKDLFVFLAGMQYRRYLVPRMVNVQVPLEGMGIGKQLQFLTQNVEPKLPPIEDYWDE